MDLSKYNIIRAISLHVDRKPLDGLEGEVNAEIARTQGKANGFFVPRQVLRSRQTIRRALDSSTGSKLVTQNWQGYIDALRNRSIIAQVGGRILGDLENGLLNIPVKSATTTAYWVAEAGAPTGSAPTVTGQRQLTPKTIGGYTDVTRSLLKSSSYDVSQLVIDDLVESIALGIDAAAINGTGNSNQPTGMLALSQLTVTDAVTNGTTAVTSVTGGFTSAMIGQRVIIAGDGTYQITARPDGNTLTVDRNTGTGTAQTANITAIPQVALGANGAALSWANVTNFEAVVGAANADGDGSKLAYLTNSAVRQKLKNTCKIGTTVPPFIMKSDGTLNGHACGISNSIASNGTKGTASAVCSTMIYGNFDDLVIGLFGDVDLNIDWASLSTSGIIRLVALQSADIAIRRTASFMAATDILTA